MPVSCQSLNTQYPILASFILQPIPDLIWPWPVDVCPVPPPRRSVGPRGGALTDEELEWAVLCLEEAEERMAALDFSTAAGMLERVLGRWVIESNEAGPDPSGRQAVGSARIA